MPGAGSAPAGDARSTWRLYAEYWRMVRRHVPERRERLRCYACLVGWLAVSAARLLLMPIRGLNPQLGGRGGDARQRVVAAARGLRVAALRHR